MFDELGSALLTGDSAAVFQLTEAALQAGNTPSDLLEQVLIPTMDVVGAEYENGIRYIPEMLISAEAMKEAMKILRPLLSASGVAPRGRILIGTVEGDLHDIGKDLVATMLEGAGYEVVDLGVEVKAERFVEAIREYKPDVLAMSALLTTTMSVMPQVIDQVREEGLRESIKIIVGGAPITVDYAKRIGADGYGDDATAAVSTVRQLLANGA